MIGEKIRVKRKELGLSLKELADQTGLTPGFISQVERDLAEPSITSLRKISKVLNVAVFYFLMEEETENPVVRKDEGKILNFRDSHINYELLCPDLNRSMEIFKAKLDPGAVTCEEPLSHKGEEVTHVLAGEMSIILGDKTYTLQAGDTIYYYCDIPHKIINIGKEELIFISIITPPEF